MGKNMVNFVDEERFILQLNEFVGGDDNINSNDGIYGCDVVDAKYNVYANWKGSPYDLIWWKNVASTKRKIHNMKLDQIECRTNASSSLVCEQQKKKRWAQQPYLPV